MKFNIIGDFENEVVFVNDKELRKLKRKELLEIMLSQAKLIEELENELAKTKKELSYIQSTERTTVAEQVQNIMDNAKYTFGQSIAKDAGSYLTWKVSNLMIDVFDSVTQTVGTNTKEFLLQVSSNVVPPHPVIPLSKSTCEGRKSKTSDK